MQEFWQEHWFIILLCLVIVVGFGSFGICLDRSNDRSPRYAVVFVQEKLLHERRATGLPVSGFYDVMFADGNYGRIKMGTNMLGDRMLKGHCYEIITVDDGHDPAGYRARSVAEAHKVKCSDFGIE